MSIESTSTIRTQQVVFLLVAIACAGAGIFALVQGGSRTLSALGSRECFGREIPMLRSINLTFAASELALGLAALLIAYVMVVYVLSRGLKSVAVVGVSLILGCLGGIGAGTANVMYYTYVSGWATLFSDTSALLALGGMTAVVLAALVVVWIASVPSANLAFCETAFDGLIVLLTIAVVWSTWLAATGRGAFSGVFLAFLGLAFIFLVYRALRLGDSILSLFLQMLGVARQKDAFCKQPGLIEWLNSYLPNPIDQEALFNALIERRKRARKRRTGIHLIILGGGTWLLLTALAKLVGWIIDRVAG